MARRGFMGKPTSPGGPALVEEGLFGRRRDPAQGAYSPRAAAWWTGSNFSRIASSNAADLENHWRGPAEIQNPVTSTGVAAMLRSSGVWAGKLNGMRARCSSPVQPGQRYGAP